MPVKPAVLRIVFEIPYTVEAFEQLDDNGRQAYGNAACPADMARDEIRGIEAGNFGVFELLDAAEDTYTQTFEVVELDDEADQ